MCNHGNSELWHIDNLGMFRTLTFKARHIFRTLSKWSILQKWFNYFSKAVYLRSLTAYSLTCRLAYIALCIVRDMLRTLSFIVNSDILRHIHVLLGHIQRFCGTFRNLCNSCIFRILAYLEPEIYPELCLPYSECFVKLEYWEPCHIKNFGIFRTRGIFRILFI